MFPYVSCAASTAAALAGTEFDGACCQSEQGVVATAANVQAGVEVGAALANENLACVDGLAAVALNTEVLGVRVTAVTGGACALLCAILYSTLGLNSGRLNYALIR